ncbi:RmlC-like cupin domain superfamily [Sesbania bispinosa]|nr:RmlC-like cupin domain superfamily [Sesbania bispinosa]
MTTRVQAERSSSNTMMGTTATPRRSPAMFNHLRPSYLASFLQRPHSLPFVLSIFLLLAWISIRTHRSSPPLPLSSPNDDVRANLHRFSSFIIPSRIAKDNRGWLLDPLSLALASGISGGAVTCASLHVGEIRPGKFRGNHRHHDCNETFVIWGAATKFRLENSEVPDTGYAEVTIGGDEIAVAASPAHTAHALVNIDPIRSTFIIGCQDSIINYNNGSSTDFNVWKDL